MNAKNRRFDLCLINELFMYLIRMSNVTSHNLRLNACFVKRCFETKQKKTFCCTNGIFLSHEFKCVTKLRSNKRNFEMMNLFSSSKHEVIKNKQVHNTSLSFPGRKKRLLKLKYIFTVFII